MRRPEQWQLPHPAVHHRPLQQDSMHGQSLIIVSGNTSLRTSANRNSIHNTADMMSKTQSQAWRSWATSDAAAHDCMTSMCTLASLQQPCHACSPTPDAESCMQARTTKAVARPHLRWPPQWLMQQPLAGHWLGLQHRRTQKLTSALSSERPHMPGQKPWQRPEWHRCWPVPVPAPG